MAKIVQKIDQISNSELTLGLKNNATKVTTSELELNIDKQLSLNDHKLTDISDPTEQSDAVNKKYVDDYTSANDTEISNIESSVGLNTDGTRTNNTSGYNYIEKTNNESIVTSIRSLDTQLGSASASVENLNNIKANKISGASTTPGNLVVVGSNHITVGPNDYYEIVQSDLSGTELVTLNDNQTITNKIIDADNNSISNLTTSNIKSGNIVTVGETTPLFVSKDYVDSAVERSVNLKNSLDLTANQTEPTAYNTNTIVSPIIGDTYVITVAGYVTNVRIPGGTIFTATGYATINDWITYTEAGWILLHSSDDKAVWGNISGDITTQSDLNSALNLKADKAVSNLNTIATIDSNGNSIGSGLVASTTLASNIDDTHLPTSKAVNDAITASVPKGSQQTLFIDISYTDIAAGKTSSFVLKSGTVIRKVCLVITTPFIPSIINTPTLVDVNAGTLNIMNNLYNDTTSAAIYASEDFNILTSDNPITITFSNDSTAGAGRIYIDYIESPINAN